MDSPTVFRGEIIPLNWYQSLTACTLHVIYSTGKVGGEGILMIFQCYNNIMILLWYQDSLMRCLMLFHRFVFIKDILGVALHCTAPSQSNLAIKLIRLSLPPLQDVTFRQVVSLYSILIGRCGRSCKMWSISVQ